MTVGTCYSPAGEVCFGPDLVALCVAASRPVRWKYSHSYHRTHTCLFTCYIRISNQPHGLIASSMTLYDDVQYIVWWHTDICFMWPQSMEIKHICWEEESVVVTYALVKYYINEWLHVHLLWCGTQLVSFFGRILLRFIYTRMHLEAEGPIRQTGLGCESQ